MYKFITLALAAAVSALPAGGSPTDLEKGEFRTFMTVSVDKQVSLNGIRNGTSENLSIVGERISVYPGTQTVSERNTQDPGESISFHVNGEKYGWAVTDVGHAWGNVHPVVARKGYEGDFKFHTSNGEITHDLTATTNSFMACDSNINGVNISVLAWGNPNYDGTLPEGCAFTKVSMSEPKE
ncbi:uncharacterized protein RCC_10859 [Ramularia collo-cygni]|uniref:Uncharacterized protein n=1 Tax=Ramularia collo-cygni TaxID=112498 RepID=A0A2D3VDG6_9PEZI|nr:uncharacterized protein RCC_10859 [Ramularia collo-cygni]CZT25130.1 uncharacterized protein RCC_10859 [Ramularia collo-cygni]